MNVGKSGQVPARKAGRRRLAAGLCGAVGLGVLFGATGAWAQAAPPARTTLVVAAYPAVDEIVRKALPAWQRRHPTVDVKVVSRAFADHHTAMTTALSTAFYLPDVMALEVGYVGRFAQGAVWKTCVNSPMTSSASSSAGCPMPWPKPRLARAVSWRCPRTLARAPCCIAKTSSAKPV
ncbi:hypothetical protein [Ideonella paludis]|uniref:hypothetical protein n=1 Tax=Ideonella paludis TaxID=1233411 RepID=UPI003636D5C2